ncbi:MAG: phytanoyl-CoA dioxygenase family protein, partial [Myxococcota bacterium]|nr:phytanoyl-CoA dioxygenase family protein [Myxococcota bacterium]
MGLSQEHVECWEQKGCLHLPGFFGDGELLSHWTDELYRWPEKAGAWMKYFEAAKDGRDMRMLCRVENFLSFHAGWRSAIEDPRLFEILAVLFDEEALLFKEKINFKLPGGNGFTAHQDAPAFAAFEQTFHITAMISIDASTVQNGCLEMAYGRHKEGLFEMTTDKVLSQDAINAMH